MSSTQTLFCTGMSWEEKVGALIQKLKNLKVDGFVVTALDEIAWLLNLRGSDIPFNPGKKKKTSIWKLVIFFCSVSELRLFGSRYQFKLTSVFERARNAKSNRRVSFENRKLLRLLYKVS